MKVTAILSALLFALLSIGGELPFEPARLNYFTTGTMDGGVVRGTPKDHGASIDLKLPKKSNDFSEARCVTLIWETLPGAPALKASDFALNFRTRERGRQIQVRGVAGPGKNEVIFSFDKNFADVTLARLYINVSGRFTGKPFVLKAAPLKLRKSAVDL